ncbi:CHASE domain-containing protein [Sphingomonas sp. BN140010]|uniref:histidine kinase n=1 Tax=Sphingomonas arvum TaxID=2992113 RepID=A0ABT3JEB1_9SPHN|nr:CHASE domain-containing protein [Sphingomonas sp. BN140010]MCW3797412.1 CHASE domain-containing protein [Sphingomonas sp. BN140010]
MFKRRYLAPAVILLLGLLVSWLAASQLARAEERRSLARFEGAAAGAVTAVANKMNLQLALLRGTRGLFRTSTEVTEADFAAYVGGLELDRNYPGILGIGYVEAGLEGRPISGQEASGAGLRSAIRFIAPLNRRNRVALGIDMLTESTRREAMLRAWNTDQPALSGVVQLVQDTHAHRQPGFLLYIPARSEDGVFRGWVYSPLRGRDLFGSIFGKPEYAGLRISVYDGPVTAENRLFANGTEPGLPRHHRTTTLPIAGRDLQISVETTDEFERAAPLTLPILVGVLGVLASALLAALSYQQGRTVERIARRVDVATAELREANARLRAEAEARSEAEAQLFQAQKMEAVGQLTGGMAHDFNNMLAVVIGSLDFARHTDDPTRLHKLIEQALKGATKAAELTQRLLAFSRRQTLQPSVLDVNALVGDMSELLRRTLGGSVQLQTVQAGDLWSTFADPSQLESAILNLAVNARDAMPDGGRLTIETVNCQLDESYSARHAEVEPGDYVLIAVTDTGQGMTPEVQARVLEPFFTTKEVGKGTGLGLPQVFGFVKQTGGHLGIYSEPGRGTTIKLYLPRHAGAGAMEEAVPSLPRPEQLPRGRADELILAVEDEEDVRLLSVGALRDLGYTVIHAANGAEALRCLQSHPGVRLVFTDIVMPEMDGIALAAAIRERHPNIRLLFTTGFARGGFGRSGAVEQRVELLAKPFTITQLAAKVREVLDAPARPAVVV